MGWLHLLDLSLIPTLPDFFILSKADTGYVTGGLLGALLVLGSLQAQLIWAALISDGQGGGQVTPFLSLLVQVFFKPNSPLANFCLT